MKPTRGFTCTENTTITPRNILQNISRAFSIEIEQNRGNMFKSIMMRGQEADQQIMACNGVLPPLPPPPPPTKKTPQKLEPPQS